MGLFDGAPPEGRGAVADLAQLLALPVVLVVDAARMAGSVAPLVAGFAGFREGVRVAGVILNNVGSDRHEAMLRRALVPKGLRARIRQTRQMTTRPEIPEAARAGLIARFAEDRAALAAQFPDDPSLKLAYPFLDG